MAKITLLLTADRFFTASMHADCEVAVKTSDFISSLCTECSANNVKSNVVNKVHIAGVINKAPSWIAIHDTATNNGRRSNAVNTIAMKMHGVTPSRVGSRLLHKETFFIKIGIIQWSQFVRTPKIFERSIGNIHIPGVHEHHMSTAIKGRVLRTEDHIAREIGNMNLEMVAGGAVVVA